MISLNFLVNRLLRMSPFEIVYRLKHRIQFEIIKRFFRHCKFNCDVKYAIPVLLKNHTPNPTGNSENILATAAAICDGKMDIFHLKDQNLGETVNYHMDYKSYLVAPVNEFGIGIDYRNSSKLGDIKYIWELNRHLYLTTLSIGYDLSKEPKYLVKFEYFLSEWFRQNPCMYGVNWSSSLELGIRLLNWTIGWHLVSEFIDKELQQKWLESVYRHCWFINNNFSAYSSANNHLVGEAAGLFLASIALPKFDRSSQWREKAYRILIRECQKQNYPDGVNKEQAISYQQFVLDFLIIAGLTGKAVDRDFPSEYWRTIEKMMDYVATLEDVSGNFPQLGDEDDGLVVDLGQKEYGIYRSLLNTGAFLFNRKDFLKDDWKRDAKTQLLLNIANIDTTKLPTGTKTLPHRFDDGGYYILGTDLGKSIEQKLIFDCGPLGYLSLAAHGHADALSFFFSAGGCPIFIDPGTYAYHTNKKWRDYFRGSTAHNTVCIDGMNQSTIAGNFMWSQKAKAYLIEYQDLIKVKGWHDGYLRLQDKVKHTREINYNEQIDTWQITDQLECKDRHEAALYFHLHPECGLKMRDHKVEINFRNGTCFLEPPADCQVTVFEGNESVPLGWYSPSYDVKAPTKTLKMSLKIKGSTTLITEFKVRFKGGKVN
jgi:hypothetical protein